MCYEVVVGIVSNGRNIGRTVIPVRAENVFEAINRAEAMTDNQYGRNSYGHAVKVQPVSEEEFNLITAA